MLHIKRNGTTGQLMFIALQNMQQMIGYERPFYEQKFENYAYLLPDSWLKHLCEYTSSRGIDFELTRPPTFKKQRKNDQLIMDVLTPHFSTDHLKKINKIRTHLKILRLSDMTDISGKHILPNIIEGVNYRQSTYGWMNQPLVPKYLPLWKQACARLQQALDNRTLGAWINKSQRWIWSSNSTGSVISNDSKTYVRQTVNGRYKYVMHNNSPSILPYAADVFIKRNKPQLLCIFTEEIQIERVNDDVYDRFF